MKNNSLRSSTAIMVALSLIQPLPGLAQSDTGVSSQGADILPIDGESAVPDISTLPNLICTEAGIDDPLACALFLEERAAAGEAVIAPESIDAPAPAIMAEPEAADQTQAEEDARAAAEAEAEALAAEQRAAEAAALEARAAEDAQQQELEAKRAADAAAAAQAAEDDAAAEAAAQVAEDEADAAAKAAEDDAAAALAAENEAAAEAEQQADILATETAEADAAEVARQDAEIAAAQAAADALAEEAAVETLAASEAEADATAEVTTEVLTENEIRSSDEEFQELTEDELARRAAGQAPLPIAGSGGGLSDLERAGLLALGAVVVGAIVMNGQRVEAQTGDRVIVVDDAGTYTVLKDDDALLRAPGSEVRTERFSDGSTRSVVVRADGTRIVTVRDVNGRALRRVRVDPDGREYLLIDDTRDFQPVVVRDLPPPIRETFDYQAATDRETLRLALLAADRRDLGRTFSLRQVRDIVEVRELAPEINLGGITFETASAAIPPAQAERLREMGTLMSELIRDNPRELFLIEGHTDAVGDAGYNLLLSDRRAESVALAFSEYFGVGAENMIVQGYGERYLRVPTQAAERANRRVAVRRITALVQQN